MKRAVSIAIIGILCFSMFSAILGRQLRLAQATRFFQDGFETGDLSKWTPIGGSPTVTSGDTHHGTYKAVLDASNEWAQVRFTGVDHSFMRAYVMFKSFPTTGTETTVLGLYNWANGRYTAEVRVINDTGTIKWRLRYWHNGNHYSVTSEQQKPVLDMWYCVEVEGISNTTTNAESRIYIDGNELTDVSQTGRNNTYTITCAYVWASSTVTRWYDCVVVDTVYIGQETPPSIGEFATPPTVYANQYFYLNATIDAGKTLALTDFDNATVQVGENIVLGWINSTDTFSEISDPNNQVTLNASASLRSAINSTAYKLSWFIKLNNYPIGNVSIEAANTKVFDSGGFYGSSSEPNLFRFIGPLSVAFQARDADGANLTRSVQFNGTMANGTLFSVNSDENGHAAASICYGSATVDTWWGTHLVQTSVLAVTENASFNIDTKIRRLTSDSNYLLFSLNQTALPSPSLVGAFDWQIENAAGEGVIEFKMDNADWIKTSEPYSFTIDNDTHYGGWVFEDSVFTFPIEFSTTKTLAMSWMTENYTLSIITTDGGTTDPVPGTYSYLNGTEVDVLAIPSTNYIFGHWELDEIDIGSSNPVRITMESNHTLEAFFVYSVHDIILTGVAPEKTIVGQGYSTLINVTVHNSGNYTETFNVTVYVNSTEIEQLQLTLNSGATWILAFTWNTTDFIYGNYNITSYAWPVPEEANTTDNTIVDGWVFVTIAGDVDGTRKVDMRDLGAIGRAFSAIPSDPRWNANIDINNDGVIDMRDIGIAARNFGKSW